MKSPARKHFTRLGPALAVLSFVLIVGAFTIFAPFPSSIASRSASTATGEGARTRIVFSGGLVCEGREGDVPASAWQASLHNQLLAVEEAPQPWINAPSSLLASGAGNLTLHVAGWKAASIRLPPADEGVIHIREPIALARETSPVALAMPSRGTDYDIAEIVWLRALDSEPLALPLGKSAFVPLDFQGVKQLGNLPTGIYHCVIKGRDQTRTQDFDLCPELLLTPVKEHTAAKVVSLPPALPHKYIGFAGFAANPPPDTGWTGFFCGLELDLRGNSGNLSLTFRPLPATEATRYDDLKPRPDTMWPISGVFLKDPVSISFDCPLSHIDHRVTLSASDGQFTLLPEMIRPEDERQRKETFARMKNLIANQSKYAQEHPDDFDPRFSRVPLQKLPNFDYLGSLDAFSKHLLRLSRVPAKPIELGSEVTVLQVSETLWRARIDRIP